MDKLRESGVSARRRPLDGTGRLSPRPRESSPVGHTALFTKEAVRRREFSRGHWSGAQPQSAAWPGDCGVRGLARGE